MVSSGTSDAISFAGRQHERTVLHTWLAAAVQGTGGIGLVVGEPGIGKTALCAQFAADAVRNNAVVLAGHCYEDGALSLPYRPFVEALRTYVAGRDRALLVEELSAGAPEIALIVPELRERLALAPPSAAASPAEARYRLLEAVARFLRAAAAATPLVLLLEDLHDADRGTLDLLLHLAGRLAGSRLLVIGTYRDVAVDRTHPLSAALAELRRSVPVERLQLRGLSVAEVGHLVAGVIGRELTSRLVEQIHHQTEGNPLFVQEVVRCLVDGGLVDGIGMRPGSGSALIQRLPEGLRDVIGRRLARLSPACNRLLAVAAVVGREFRLDVVEAVAGLQEEAVITAVEEMTRAGVVAEHRVVGPVVTYRFSHALFRQTLYEELSAPRRLRLHQQVGRQLEQQYRDQLAEHAVEFADHFAHSPDLADLAKARHYSELAAQRATAVCAHGEAARHLERALAVQAVLNADDTARRVDLLLALAESLTASGEARRTVEEVAPLAWALAEAVGDAPRAARVCELALYALGAVGSGPGLVSAAAGPWVERADRHAQPDSVARVWADLFTGIAHANREEHHEMAERLTRALTLARRLGEPDARWYAAGAWVWFRGAPQHTAARLRLAEEVAGWPRTGARGLTLAYALLWFGEPFLQTGQRSRTEALWEDLRALSERTGDVYLQLWTMRTDTVLWTVDGRLAEVVALGERMLTWGTEVGIPDAARVGAALGCGRALLYLGRTAEVLQQSGPALPSVRALCLAEAGRIAEAALLLEEWVVARPGFGTAADETPLRADVTLLEAAVSAGHRPAAALLLRRCADCGLGITGNAFPTCIDRHLGAAAALLGDRARARAHYAEALRVAGSVRFLPELALTNLQLAELLADQPADANEARSYLNAALPELARMEMQPALQRAHRLAARLAAAPPDHQAARSPDVLTARELDVLRLVVAGKRNSDIAAQLVISINTVERHITHILAKIGATNRTEAATYAARHGLEV
jgi:DNA-binding CsgD family transcriptional regulator